MLSFALLGMEAGGLGVLPRAMGNRERLLRLEKWKLVELLDFEYLLMLKVYWEMCIAMSKYCHN